MIRIAFVYYTNTDVTGELIRSAFEEIDTSGVEVFSHRISGSEIIEGRFVNQELMTLLHSCSGIVFGSPTYMGNVAAQFKAFADATSDFWSEQKWSGKVAAGITSGTGLNGDQTCSLQYFSTLASQHGMLWVGLDTPYSNAEGNVNRLGCQLGVTACSTDGDIHPGDSESAKYLARRVLEICQKLARNSN